MTGQFIWIRNDLKDAYNVTTAISSNATRDVLWFQSDFYFYRIIVDGILRWHKFLKLDILK